jgi:L-ribulose-5-phosphate 3-epimerase
MTHLDFPAKARVDFGLEGVEFVNSFFKDKARDEAYLAELDRRCKDVGVTSLLIMCDGEGELGDADDAARARAIENHRPWLEAAARLGCHSIRVNAAGQGERDEVARRVADSLVALAGHAEPLGLSVIVENHGGLSSDGAWLAGVMRLAAHPRVGTLPDFGNFHLGDGREYDRYRGVEELMPFAKAVSAKSHDFDDAGACVETDYVRMLRIVHAAGYRGWIGVEYEGHHLDEASGIQRTKALLERVRAELS